ncbi:C-C motif chemokine 19-like [Dendropsophus ebraccatus]|uniref:C-C motif chemokine 19-like n=1 Tax=Dendropsophus ebraccatus TaxID=150705 RepID=UPI003831227D
MFTMRVLLGLALLAICVTKVASSDNFNTCCTKVSAAKPKPGTVLRNFIIQQADDPCVHAVLFITSEGKVICSTPGARWVQSKIKEIKRKNEQEENY